MQPHLQNPVASVRICNTFSTSRKALTPAAGSCEDSATTKPNPPSAMVASLSLFPSRSRQHLRRCGMGMAQGNDRGPPVPEKGVPIPVNSTGAGMAVDAPMPMSSRGRDGCPQPSGRMDDPWHNHLPSASLRTAGDSGPSHLAASCGRAAMRPNGRSVSKGFPHNSLTPISNKTNTMPTVKICTPVPPD